MTVLTPRPGQRLRCAGCGNLTRFDVVVQRRSAEFWHLNLLGDAVVEEADVADETVESVTCRWCGRSDAVEWIDRETSTSD